MSIFERIVGVVACLGAPLLVWNCAVPGQCLRYSDCNQGLTCAAGKCVVPPTADASDEADAAMEADAHVVAFDSGAGPDAVAADAPVSFDSASADEGGLDATPAATPDAEPDATGDATAD